MSSTFFGLNIASSALFAFQASSNTTANNISNVQTKGYSKQVTNLRASGALRVNAAYGTIGSGVTAVSVTQLRDQYYDTKYWRNQSSVGLYQKRLYYMEQIENVYNDDDVTTGFATIFNSVFNAMDSLKNYASDSNVRNQFISSAQNLTNYFNGVYTQMSNMQADINNEIKSTVDSLNSISEKIALLNKQINSIEIQGGYANELRDERALLVDELAEIVPIEIKEFPVSNSNYPDMYTGATHYQVKLNGQNLVDDFEYHEITYTARENKINQTDAEGLFDLTWADTGVTFNPTGDGMSGVLRALFEMRDGNNCAGFRGTAATGDDAFGTKVVDGKTVTTVTIENPSITELRDLHIAQEGIITIRNNRYTYSDFVMNKKAEVDANGDPVLDADGNQKYTYSYTFTLEKELSPLEKGRIAGKTASIGENIDSMGIPYYMAQMSEFIRVFAESFNKLQQGTAEDPGVDLNGNVMGAFFVADNKVDGSEYDFGDTTISSYSNSYYQLTAATFAVADASIKDPSRVATMSQSNFTAGVDSYDIIDATLKLQSDTSIYRGSAAKDFLRCLLSDITVDTNEASLFADNYTNIQNIIDIQRQSVSGVDEDEESLELVKFRNAYNLACKTISVLSEMYDKLINGTGV